MSVNTLKHGYSQTCCENMLKSTAFLPPVSQSCPLKPFLMGSYYAAEIFLKAAPTQEEKLNTLCNTTVQLHKKQTETLALPCMLQPLCALFCDVGTYLLLACLDPFLFSREIQLLNQQTTLHVTALRAGFTTAIANSSVMWATQQTVLCLRTSNFIPEAKLPLWNHHLCQFCWKTFVCSLSDSRKGILMWGVFFPSEFLHWNTLKDFSNQWLLPRFSLVCCLLKYKKQKYIFLVKKGTNWLL